jgi:hypothetical protein
MTEPKTISELYAVYRDGDKLSDDELRVLHDHMGSTYRLTVELGETFRLAASEAWSVYNTLGGYISARREHYESNCK